MKDYQHYSMDDIIFEHRNKAYGAYQLRQESEKNATYGLLLTASGITAAVLFALFIPHSQHVEIPTIIEAATSNVVIETPPPTLPKPITPPKRIAPPPAGNTQAFTTIDPTTTAPTTDVAPPKQSDLMASAAAISSADHVAEAASTSTAITTETGSGTTAEIPETPKIVHWSEVMPSFAGGNEALMKYLKSHIAMDSRDVEMGISGKVIVQFYIDIDGTVRDAKVIKDTAGGHCAERALSAVNNMPRWVPGRQGDKAVRVYHTLPISFQVN